MDSFDFGDVALQRGGVLRSARLAYKTFGKLNSERTNVIVYPTSFGAQHPDLEWLIGPGKALDPGKYFIVIPNMFGNGLSSSPSDYPDAEHRRQFPRITMYDNVLAATSVAAGAFRCAENRARRRLFNGRAAGVSLGRVVSGHGRTYRPDHQLGEDRTAQPRVSGRGKSGSHARSGLAGRCVRGAAGSGHPRHGAGICGLGTVTSVLSRGPAP